MRHCIPYELFNLIPYPSKGLNVLSGTTAAPKSNIDRIVREIVYKMPKAADVIVHRETWHAVCDFCVRTGACLERMIGGNDRNVVISPVCGDFLRIVGAYKNGSAQGAIGEKTDEFEFQDSVEPDTGNNWVLFPDGCTYNSLIVSVTPRFSDDFEAVPGSGWTPRVPQYVIDQYGECIMHGALMRLFAMTKEAWGDLNLARMHAVSYNNDLNRLSFGLITSGMRKHLLVDMEDFLIQANGNG